MLKLRNLSRYGKPARGETALALRSFISSAVAEHARGRALGEAGMTRVGRVSGKPMPRPGRGGQRRDGGAR